MKSRKYVIMSRYYMHGVYSNRFVKHAELYDSKVDVEFTYDPGEAAIFHGRKVAYRYASLLNSLIHCGHVIFFIDKVGRVCRPNGYLVYSHKTDEALVFRSRDRAESALEYLKLFKPSMYPIYGYVGDYDY